MEEEGLDVLSCLRQLKHQAKYIKQWHWRHWVLGNKGQGLLKQGKEKKIYVHTNTCAQVFTATLFCNSSKLETTLMSIKRWMDR